MPQIALRAAIKAEHWKGELELGWVADVGRANRFVDVAFEQGGDRCGLTALREKSGGVLRRGGEDDAVEAFSGDGEAVVNAFDARRREFRRRVQR